MAPIFCDRCGDAVEEEGDLLDELDELDALLERLILKRCDLKRKINRVHSPVIVKLPPDVTSTIFEFCLPDFTDNQLSPDTKEDLSIPLSLGAICSYWREIAWSTPKLWSSLVVRVPNKLDSHTVTGMTQEWLARSGDLPLSISILSESTSHNNEVSALAEIINQYSTRWSELDLYLPDIYYPHFHAIDNHAPTLKSIRFYCSYKLIDLNFKLTCPRLERATLSDFLMDGAIDIQWDTLTHLTLHSMFVLDYLPVLGMTPRLVYCKVSGTPPYRSSEMIIGAPVITSLRSLELLITNHDAQFFLNNVIAPHLEEFSFPNFYHPPEEGIGLIASFLKRSACSLRSFSIMYRIFPPYLECFMDLLQSMSSLNTLSIISITTTTRYSNDIGSVDYDPRNILELVAKVLSSQSASLKQGFLPNLQVLEYNGKLNLPPDNYDELYPLPPTDNAVHGPLHLLKLDLHSANRIPKNMISYLSSVVDRGVVVNVFSHSYDILQWSIDYYKSREESLSRDWTDDFDSDIFS